MIITTSCSVNISRGCNQESIIITLFRVTSRIRKNAIDIIRTITTCTYMCIRQNVIRTPWFDLIVTNINQDKICARIHNCLADLALWTSNSIVFYSLIHSEPVRANLLTCSNINCRHRLISNAHHDHFDKHVNKTHFLNTYMLRWVSCICKQLHECLIVVVFIGVGIFH